MNKNNQTKQNKEVYEAPKAEISIVFAGDILNYSINTPWDQVKTKRKYDF